MKISFVIPAHNERANIANMLRLLVKNFSKVTGEIIIVNDCSTDQSEKLLNDLKRKYKRLKVINRKYNGGVGNAIREGLRNISPKSDYVFLLDCDFIENTRDIKKMISSVSNADGLLGSRYLKKGSLVNYPLAKKIANRGFHFLMNTLLDISYKDVTNNFKLYKKEVILKIAPYLISEGFSVNAETGIYPILMKYKIKEIPVSWIGRTADMGNSNFKILKAGPGYFKVLLRSLNFKNLSSKKKHDQEEERKHFDELIRKTGETNFANLRPIARIRFGRKAKTILTLSGSKNIKILDLGCGTGILSKYILEQNPQVYIEGVDISPNAIEVARKNLKKFKNAKFKVGDTGKLPFKDNTFDIIAGNSILHHVSLEEAIPEIIRVGNECAKVWFSEPNYLNPQIFIQKHVPFIKSLMQDSEDERAFFRWEMLSIFKKYEFKDVKVQPYEFLHPFIPKAYLTAFAKFCIFLEKVPVVKELAGTIEVIATVQKILKRRSPENLAG